MLREAWGIGRVVVLLVGSELFAITPLDKQGDPNPEFLWSNPIDLQSSPGDTRIVSGLHKPNESKYLVVDQSNRPIGKVGPVRAGYFCYQKGTKLVAAETDTGKTLWERLDLPADATVLGDDHFIFLWRDSNLLEILSVVDGRKIEERVWQKSPNNMIHHRGANVWTINHGEEVTLEVHDLTSGNLVWSRKAPRETQTVMLDSETVGQATPDGQFHLLSARTGKPISSPLFVKADSPKEIVAWQDVDRWYVALSHPEGNLSTLKNIQLNDSYRLRFITGTLFAIDRQQPRIVWEQKLKDEAISLEQSRTAPVLVQLWKLPPKGSELTLRLIDKRTGKLLIEKKKDDLSPYFLLNADPQQGILELKLARETIRLQYVTD